MTAAAERSLVFRFAGFSLDPRRRQLFGVDGRPVPLSSRAFDALLFLIEHSDRLVDKQSLMRAVWPSTVVEENSLDRQISLLRRAFNEKPGEHRFVVTVPGRGYRFVPPVEVATQDAASAEPVRSVAVRLARVLPRVWTPPRLQGPDVGWQVRLLTCIRSLCRAKGTGP